MSERKENLNVLISTVAEAENVIVDDARQKVIALDWQHFGIDLKGVETFFNITWPLILRQSGQNPPFNVLDNKDPHEFAILCSLPYDWKKKSETTGRFWLAIFKQISSEEATFLRDWLWLKAPEVIAAGCEIDSTAVAEYFFKSNQGYRQSAFRIAGYLGMLPKSR